MPKQPYRHVMSRSLCIIISIHTGYSGFYFSHCTATHPSPTYSWKRSSKFSTIFWTPNGSPVPGIEMCSFQNKPLDRWCAPIGARVLILSWPALCGIMLRYFNHPEKRRLITQQISETPYYYKFYPNVNVVSYCISSRFAQNFCRLGKGGFEK